MAASDTFEWFIATMKKNPSPELLEAVREARIYLQTLRSEDERQRFVAETMERLHGTVRARL
jgi:hypothetical protein